MGFDGLFAVKRTLCAYCLTHLLRVLGLCSAIFEHQNGFQPSADVRKQLFI
jgi:hypothetical protein